LLTLLEGLPNNFSKASTPKKLGYWMQLLVAISGLGSAVRSSHL
jgi:hypothetical protein